MNYFAIEEWLESEMQWAKDIKLLVDEAQESNINNLNYMHKIMNIDKYQLIGGAAIALPLVAFAILGVGGGTLFANVASAGYGQEQVTICHRVRNTLTVAAPAVEAHLDHGDTLGACLETERDDRPERGPR